jgi:ankyrin repeat protein
MSNKYLKQIFALVQQEINAQNIYGNTALILAARYGRKEIAQALLDKGANPDAQNTSGDTALDLAARYGHKEIVDLLEKATAITPEQIVVFISRLPATWEM